MRDPDGDGAERASGVDFGRLAESISTHAVFELDAVGRISGWTDPARALYGYDADDVQGRELGTLFAEPDELDPSLAETIRAAREDTVETDHWHKRADGSVFWATLTLEALDDGSGYAAVSRDTTDRMQYERTLEHRNDRLKEFTDILAHDLRTPLTVIEGKLELYQETGDGDHLEAVGRTLERMERLVEDLLEVARQGTVVSDPESTDVESVVRTAWKATEMSGDATLECASLPKMSADPDRVCELFENLFRNAVEHGSTSPRNTEDDVEHAGQEVSVRVGPMDDGFYVEDDGPGIPEDLREEVFDHGVSTRTDGSGYGLSIVRTIANAHGWDVEATSSPTGGARFEFTGVESFD